MEPRYSCDMRQNCWKDFRPDTTNTERITGRFCNWWYSMTYTADCACARVGARCTAKKRSANKPWRWRHWDVCRTMPWCSPTVTLEFSISLGECSKVGGR